MRKVPAIALFEGDEISFDLGKDWHTVAFLQMLPDAKVRIHLVEGGSVVYHDLEDVTVR